MRDELMGDDRITDDMLLDYQLGQLEDADSARVEDALGRDPELGSRLRRISGVLERLDAWSVEAPAGLEDRVLAGIGLTAAGAPWATPEPRSLRFPSFKLRDLIGLAACIVLFVGLFFPGMDFAREGARRTMCRNNLRAIGNANAVYAAGYAGAPPNAGAQPGTKWLTDGCPTIPVATNSRHQYLLVAFSFVEDPKVFLCPSRADGRHMTREEILKNKDFLPDAISFDVQNMAGPTVMLTASVCVPFMGDRNPLFEGRRFNGDIETANANSRSHRRAGQNILCNDGQVVFLRAPVSERGDNIWQAGDLAEYEGTEVQVSAMDAFFVP